MANPCARGAADLRLGADSCSCLACCSFRSGHGERRGGAGFTQAPWPVIDVGDAQAWPLAVTDCVLRHGGQHRNSVPGRLRRRSLHGLPGVLRPGVPHDDEAAGSRPRPRGPAPRNVAARRAVPRQAPARSGAAALTSSRPKGGGPVNRPSPPTQADWDLLDRAAHALEESVSYLEGVNPANGLVADKTDPRWPASIAAIGLALTAYPVGVERGYLTREQALERTLTTCVSLANGWPTARCHRPQGLLLSLAQHATASAWRELSTWIRRFSSHRPVWPRISTGTTKPRSALADALYRPADLAMRRTARPRSRLETRSRNPAVPLGSTRPSCSTCSASGRALPLPPEALRPSRQPLCWKEMGGEMVYAGPLFIHQLSPVRWIFTGIQDNYMRRKGL